MRIKTNKLLIVGGTGMLGHTLFSKLSEYDNLDVYATVRSDQYSSLFSPDQLLQKIQTGVDAFHFDSLRETLIRLKPDVVINCVGIIKHLPEARDPVTAITINSLFPHHLARACRDSGARMIHFSTDCVFSGNKGNYSESDFADADELYGRTKYLGEVDYPHCVTLRTSIIGHELKGKHGLIEWFLAQQGSVRGFTRAIYTGLPTDEMSRVIADYVIPNRNLTGLYHVSSEPISKYDLLKLVAACYGKQINISQYDDFHCDRSLDSRRFRDAIGYQPPSWPVLVAGMHRYFTQASFYKDREM